MKIVIVDDHPLVRRGLASVISMQPNVKFAGEATNGQEALLVIEETQPDLVLIDLKLADESGLDVIKKARARGIVSKFILLTSSASREDFLKAEEVLVDGYVLKEALPEELLFAIQLVHKGRKYYDPGLMEDKMRMSESSPTDELTPKEKEVLIELGQGACNREIASRLFISEFTVKKHVSQILAKLQVADRTQAALYANAVGLTKYEMSYE
ncbi:response regulator transcription factor [Paenibacillus sp. FSL E2-8871]|jgi:two-component system, NarL family, nitrate/nitrite response regulator NarL|uniref:DNA-binding response regulator n=2 Tax=Paenibacillus TaxID=44249 RepID=A0A1R0ZK66_9BACL|nr:MULTISPECIES: response regulator transcription factor [Paenibacillus]AIQ22220.1 nitrate/nitrite response regulator protein narL [Paenibacillus sp. FSL H7-0737]KAA1183336.1 response regulator transcription factor [Paenibacillus sp. B2(2019)]KTD85070.1 two-component system response regulator [Paenibacillus etheri]OMD52717.1 DNA-binding response regulator [Paenibacillus odorifer]OME72145.1 DNA-binding response regulator [Paenibacillus odorifer]